MRHLAVTTTTEDGDVIELELYPEVALGTVNNSLSFAKKGFYDDFIFHRIIGSFMIQGGCPIGNGEGGPGYVIRGGLKRNGVQSDLEYERGVISTAHTPIPGSAGNQFFIMHRAASRLDGGYAMFGKLIESEDALDRIATVEMNAADKPLKDQKIRAVAVETFGETYPEPGKLLEIKY